MNVEKSQLASLHATARALVAQAGALVVQIDALLAAPAPQNPGPVPCTRGGDRHERTQDVSGMGGCKTELCLDCGVTLES